jgi:predicted Na+-dependent transporter
MIETRFGLVVGVAFLLGLFFPGAEHAPDEIISLTIAAIIFLACFRIESHHLGETKSGKLAFYYIARFIILPVPLYYLARLFVPSLAPGVFLLALMPAGVMSPAMAALMGGNAAVSLGLVVVSSLLCPLVTPLLFGFVVDESVSIDGFGLFLSLSLVLLLPIACHVPFRKQAPVREWIDRNNTLTTMLLLALAVLLVAARQRQVLQQSPETVIIDLLVLGIIFGLFYVLPWIGLSRFSSESRIACTVSSGANNSLLGLGVALLHFDAGIVLFMVLSEVPWLLGLTLFQKHLRGHDKAPT